MMAPCNSRYSDVWLSQICDAVDTYVERCIKVGTSSSSYQAPTRTGYAIALFINLKFQIDPGQQVPHITGMYTEWHLDNTQPGILCSTLPLLLSRSSSDGLSALAGGCESSSSTTPQPRVPESSKLYVLVSKTHIQVYAARFGLLNQLQLSRSVGLQDAVVSLPVFIQRVCLRV